MATPTPTPDDLRSLVDKLREIYRRLETLERPTGTQTGSLVAQVQAALANINATVSAAIAANSYTRPQVDARVTNPGLVGPLASSSSIAGTTGTFPNGLSSLDVYSHLVTGGGNYRSVWIHETGFLGYAPSSQRFKQDIVDWDIDVSLLPMLRPVLYRYIADVANNDGHAAVHGGLIAEEVHALGLTQLVDYDDQGKPFGVNYPLVAVALIKLIQKRQMQRSHQTVTKTLSSITVLAATQTLDIVWPTPMADSDYTVIAGVTAPNGVLSSAIAYPVPGTRTAKGVTVAVRTVGVALASGQILTVEGLHL